MKRFLFKKALLEGTVLLALAAGSANVDDIRIINANVIYS